MPCLFTTSFGPQIPGFALGRTGAGRDEWRLIERSPGAANVAQTLGDAADLRLNEWLAANGPRFENDFVELYNPDPLPVSLGGMAVTDDAIGRPGRHTLPPLSFIAGGGFLEFPATGGDASAGDPNELPFRLDAGNDRIAFVAANGVVIDEAAIAGAMDGRSSGRHPDGADAVVTFAMPTPGHPNDAPERIFTTVVPIGAQWRYFNSERFDDWRESDFDDADWDVGAAPFGFEDESLPFPIQTPLSPIEIAGFFRHRFTVAPGDADWTYRVGTFVDDGAAVYVNGVEVARVRLPEGSPFASSAVNEAGAEGDFTVPPGVIVEGENVVAVEVRQVDPGSSDMIFGLELHSESPGIPGPAFANAVALLDGLRISEIHYHPADGEQLEFIELVNIGSEPLELGGVAFTDGIDFEFPAMTLAPGRFIVVVADSVAFAAEYGASITVAGEFDGRISNGGERLLLRLPPPYGAAVLRFSYNDTWYPETDGGGPSLVIEDPNAEFDAWDSASGWRPSTNPGGSPGNNGPPRIVSALTAGAAQFEPFSYQIIAENGVDQFNATGLPDGLELDSELGRISGAPTVFGVFEIELSVSNVSGAASETLTLTVTEKLPPVITSPTAVAALQGAPFEYRITADNEVDLFQVQGLPAGLSFDAASAEISGSFGATGSSTSCWSRPTRRAATSNCCRWMSRRCPCRRLPVRPRPMR